MLAPFLGWAVQDKQQKKHNRTASRFANGFLLCWKRQAKGAMKQKNAKKIIGQTKITYLVQSPLLQQCVQLFIQSGLWPSKPSVILGNHTITI